MHQRLKKQLIECASAPYRATGIVNHQWARGKLRFDPLFATLLDQGLFPDGSRIFDLGCGRGLLAAWYLAAEQLATQGQWPSTIPRPPLNLRFRGIELMERDVACGLTALHPHYGERVQLNAGDIRTAELKDTDAIAVLDVLHYIAPEEQDRLLDRIRAALKPGGVFITRIGDAGNGWRFKWSQLVDTSVLFVRDRRVGPMWFRPLKVWIKTLEERQFTVQALPMSTGTPFANTLLVCHVA